MVTRNDNRSNTRTNGARVYTKKEARDLVDRRAKRLFGISGEEFIRRLDRGELTDAPGESALAVFAEIAR